MPEYKLPDGNAFIMLTFRDFAGNGVIAKGDEVTLAFLTNGPSIDVKMTKDQAREMAGLLAHFAK